MPQMILLFLLFLKIGAFSFGGGYAMLPFIQKEFIVQHHFITSQQFLDLLAISQATPGPIAINSATFIGFKSSGIIGALSATIGVTLFAIVGLTIISKLLDKFKNNKKIDNLLIVLRPITVGFILSATLSSAIDVKWSVFSIVSFAISCLILYKKKLGSIPLIFIFGIIGIIFKFI